MFHTAFDENKKEWSGHKIPSLFNSSISIGQLVLRSLVINGSKLAQISDNDNVRMTFEDIRIKTVRAAQNLQKQGYQPKEVFGFMARNSHNLAPIVFAAFCLGCPINTLDPSFSKTELMHMLKTTKPKLMFCDIEAYELVAECLRELKNEAKIYTFGGKIGESMPTENLFAESGDETFFIPAQVDGVNDVAAIICSSGTTGFSKGVCLSHAVLIDQLSRLNYMTANDILLCFSSLYWVTGLIILLMGTLYGATRIITTQAFSAELLLKCIEKYKVTYVLNAPYQMVTVLKSDEIQKADLSSIKLYTVGGSKVALGLSVEMNSRLKNGSACNAYGMSEIGGLVTMNYPFVERDTVGKLLSGVTVKIIDETGNRLGVNLDGEICIRASYKFLGYYGNKESTDAVIDDEGFILTGDIGHFDEDGFLYLVDRKKDLLKYCGFQISPSEIEAYLIDCPEIQSVCVVGIPDDVTDTDLPAAVIVRTEGLTISEQAIYDMVAEKFADYSKLRGGVYFVDSLPTTPSGKIIRRKVKEIAVEWHSEKNV